MISQQKRNLLVPGRIFQAKLGKGARVILFIANSHVTWCDESKILGPWNGFGLSVPFNCSFQTFLGSVYNSREYRSITDDCLTKLQERVKRAMRLQEQIEKGHYLSIKPIKELIFDLGLGHANLPLRHPDLRHPENQECVVKGLKYISAVCICFESFETLQSELELELELELRDSSLIIQQREEP